jgi:hypothetical protein
VGRLPTLLGQRGPPPDADAVFVDWLRAWHGGKDDMRDLWTCIALVCWCLWRHRSNIVFEGASPSSRAVIRKIHIEAEAWSVAGLFKAKLASVDRWRVGE